MRERIVNGKLKLQSKTWLNGGKKSIINSNKNVKDLVMSSILYSLNETIY